MAGKETAVDTPSRGTASQGTEMRTTREAGGKITGKEIGKITGEEIASGFHLTIGQMDRE